MTRAAAFTAEIVRSSSRGLAGLATALLFERVAEATERYGDEGFETWNAGLRASTTWAGAVFRLGFSIPGHERAIFSPWGSRPSYVDLMQRTFSRAGEKAILASVSYDFSHLGVAGLSTIVNFVQGWDARVDGVRRDDREVDVTFDYRIPEKLGLYQGLWLRVRAAWLEEEGTGKTGTDFRVILRYDFPVL